MPSLRPKFTCHASDMLETRVSFLSSVHEPKPKLIESKSLASPALPLNLQVQRKQNSELRADCCGQSEYQGDLLESVGVSPV